MEVLSVRRYKVGYEVRKEKHTFEDDSSVVIRSAYTPNGDYLGDVKMARYLIIKRGIKPEKASSEHSICSIGFCENSDKWYGWSHRAIVGFGIGNKLFEEGWPEGTEETLFIEYGDVTISTLDEAKQAAINFAGSVS